MMEREDQSRESPVLLVDQNVFSSVAITGMFNNY